MKKRVTIEDMQQRLYNDLIKNADNSIKSKMYDELLNQLSKESQERAQEKTLRQLIEILGIKKTLSIIGKQVFAEKSLIKDYLPAAIEVDNRALIMPYLVNNYAPIGVTKADISHLKRLQEKFAKLDSKSAQAITPIEEIAPDVQQIFPIASPEKTSPSMLFKTREQHEQQAARVAAKEPEFHLVLRLRPNQSPK